MMYEVWNSDMASRFERTSLYHLDPIGGGTWYAESLTSYLSRVAEAHLVTVKALIREKFLCQHAFYQSPFNPYPNFWWIYGRMPNGTSQWAGWWATKLAQLTGHHDLFLHNLVRWSSVISIKSLLRPTAAWCPSCLDMQRSSNQPVHMQLLWAIAAVTICPRHCVELNVLCPVCARTQHPLEPSARLGYCAHCQTWLGDAPAHKTPHQEMDKLWVAQMVAELVGYPLVDTLIAPRVSFYLAITHFLNLHQGQLSSLASTVQIPKSILREWLLARAKPQLSTLLQFCFHLNTSPLTIFDWPRRQSDPNTKGFAI